MGYVYCMSACMNCGIPFMYHPNKVPSIRVNGSREPVCKVCIDRANVIRAEQGNPLLEYLPDAYEACPEEDLNYDA